MLFCNVFGLGPRCFKIGRFFRRERREFLTTLLIAFRVAVDRVFNNFARPVAGAFNVAFLGGAAICRKALTTETIHTLIRRKYQLAIVCHCILPDCATIESTHTAQLASLLSSFTDATAMSSCHRRPPETADFMSALRLDLAPEQWYLQTRHRRLFLSLQWWPHPMIAPKQADNNSSRHHQRATS